MIYDNIYYAIMLFLGSALAVGDVIAYTVGMATLNIRNLPDHVHTQLRLRAAKAGRSMEAEARAILQHACSSAAPKEWDPATLQAFFDRLYAKKRPKSATDELIAERRREAARE